MACTADPGGPGGPAHLAPKISSKSCSFQAIFSGKTPISSKFWAQGPALGSKLCWASLTKILDPCLMQSQTKNVWKHVSLHDEVRTRLECAGAVWPWDTLCCEGFCPWCFDRLCVHRCTSHWIFFVPFDHANLSQSDYQSNGVSRNHKGNSHIMVPETLLRGPLVPCHHNPDIFKTHYDPVGNVHLRNKWPIPENIEQCHDTTEGNGQDSLYDCPLLLGIRFNISTFTSINSITNRNNYTLHNQKGCKHCGF